MDDQYLDAFIRESEEAITELNNSLLDLESDPSDQEAMDSIFRTAHTLKGNFGAMGFEDASQLAHAIEDLLDAMRQGEMEVTSERMDLIFAGVDQIDLIVDEIEQQGESTVDTSETVSQLRAVLEAGDRSADSEYGDEATDDESGSAVQLAEATVTPEDADGRVIRAAVTMTDSDMLGIDAMLILEELEELFDLLDTEPTRDRIEEGEFGDEFVMYFDAPGSDPVESEIAEMSDVDSVQTQDVTDALEARGAQPAATEATEAGAETDEATADASAVEPSATGDTTAVSGPSAGSKGTAGATGAGHTGGTGATGGSGANAGSKGGTGATGGTGAAGGTGATGDSDASSDAASGTPGGGDGSGLDGGDGGGGDGGGGPSDPSGGGSDATSVDEIKSVRVDVDQLDDLHGLVEQLVTSRIKLRRAVENDDLDSAGENLNELDKITANLQNTVMDMRLIPLKKVVGKFPRMVRDLARELDKEVDFTIEGEDIELDRTILTEISDPLMHIIRNSLDHGIEPPDERERQGKPRTGDVTLRASRERDHVIIEVTDDGAGLDVEGIKAQAIEQDIRSPEELEAMDSSAIYDLIFHPGFSTVDEVTDTSGRGVGMDVVHDTVTQLDGSVNVESTPGEGTTVSLRLPVTMAIVKVLFVEVGDEEYGIPLKNVDEITRTTEMKRVNGNEVIKHNDRIYPVIHLGEAFNVPGADHTNGDGPGRDDGMLIRVRESERQVALHCDEVSSQEEVVVKPLEGILSGTRGLSGTAVLGDGNIVHILDVVTL